LRLSGVSPYYPQPFPDCSTLIRFRQLLGRAFEVACLNGGQADCEAKLAGPGVLGRGD
jgi:hypothetical protein